MSSKSSLPQHPKSVTAVLTPNTAREARIGVRRLAKGESKEAAIRGVIRQAERNAEATAIEAVVRQRATDEVSGQVEFVSMDDEKAAGVPLVVLPTANLGALIVDPTLKRLDQLCRGPDPRDVAEVAVFSKEPQLLLCRLIDQFCDFDAAPLTLENAFAIGRRIRRAAFNIGHMPAGTAQYFLRLHSLG